MIEYPRNFFINGRRKFIYRINKAYTLAELLIAILIVGMCAGILGTILTNIRPDSVKVKYLKNHDALCQAIKELGSNSRIFPTCDTRDGQNINCKTRPFFNLMKASEGRYAFVSEGDSKLCTALSMILNGENLPNLNCHNQPITYKDGIDWTSSFSSNNGTQWLISTVREIKNDIGTYQTDVYFDINGNEPPNCIYNSTYCLQPDRFKLIISADGQVFYGDPIGEYYVQTRQTLTKKRIEIDHSKPDTIVSLQDNIRNFTIKKCSNENEETTTSTGNSNDKGFEYPEGAEKGFNCGNIFEGRIINCFTHTISPSSKTINGKTYSFDLIQLNWQYPIFSPNLALLINANGYLYIANIPYGTSKQIVDISQWQQLKYPSYEYSTNTNIPINSRVSYIVLTNSITPNVNNLYSQIDDHYIYVGKYLYDYAQESGNTGETVINNFTKQPGYESLDKNQPNDK